LAFNGIRDDDVVEFQNLAARLTNRAASKAIKDPELLGDTQKQRMNVDPETGENLEKLANRILEQPPNVLARVKKVLSNQSSTERRLSAI